MKVVALNGKSKDVEPMSISTLRRLVLELQVRQPITDRFEAAWRQTFSGKSVWYSSQKEHWAGWLFHYEGPGYYNRKGWDRTAEFIYNHINCPPMVLWLAESSGVDARLVRKARESAEAAGSAHPAMCAAIRREIPWPIVEECLLNFSKTKRA